MDFSVCLRHWLLFTTVTNSTGIYLHDRFDTFYFIVAAANDFSFSPLPEAKHKIKTVYWVRVSFVYRRCTARQKCRNECAMLYCYYKLYLHLNLLPLFGCCKVSTSLPSHCAWQRQRKFRRENYELDKSQTNSLVHRKYSARFCSLKRIVVVLIPLTSPVFIYSLIRI